MIATILLPALVAVLGLLLYVIASNPKVCEIGRITFLAGIFVTTYVLSGHAVHI